eukprot:1618818-Amphidinium_carterae.1
MTNSTMSSVSEPHDSLKSTIELSTGTDQPYSCKLCRLQIDSVTHAGNEISTFTTTSWASLQQHYLSAHFRETEWHAMAARYQSLHHRWHPTHVEECFGYLQDFLTYTTNVKFDRSTMSFIATCDIQMFSTRFAPVLGERTKCHDPRSVGNALVVKLICEFV